MGGFKVDFHELEARMKEMERKIQKEFANKVLEPAGEIVAEGIKESIIKDDLVDTGKLRDSIGVHSQSGNGTKSKIKVGVRKGTDQEIFRYGMTHNYGSKRGQYPAHHFIDKGFHQTKAKAEKKVKEVIHKVLEL